MSRFRYSIIVQRFVTGLENPKGVESALSSLMVTVGIGVNSFTFNIFGSRHSA
jgi:hypothetical protein